MFIQKSFKKYQVSEEIAEERVDEDIKWMLLPNGRGDPQLAILSGLEKNNAEDQIDPLMDNIKFYLYTRYLHRFLLISLLLTIKSIYR